MRTSVWRLARRCSFSGLSRHPARDDLARCLHRRKAASRLVLSALAIAVALATRAGWAATLVFPAVVPQPSGPADLVGINLQNTGTATLTQHFVTFGQAFPKGAVRPAASLAGRFTDRTRPIQMDVLATHPDGSVRFAALTTAYPQMAPGQSLGGVLSLQSSAAVPPVNLAALAPKLTVLLTLHTSTGTTTQTVDLGAALQRSLSSGKADYWLRGPAASQARVDVPVANAFHITADITGYADGRILADVQFNNDIAMGPKGGEVTLMATIALNGQATTYGPLNQFQYQDWHVLLGQTDVALNVQHDVAYLIRQGAALPYSLTTGVAATTLAQYAATAGAAGFGKPLAVNGVTQYMPTTGGRGDVGYTTQYDSVWLLTQDMRAARLGLAQGDTAGAVPWNMKLADGHWLTPGDFPKIWSDPRGGPGSFTTGLTQHLNAPVAGWTPDPAHQPNLAYVPYLMTGSRWYLDRLNAEAAFDLTWDWPTLRCTTAACDGVVNGGDQVRQQAWALREIVEAGWIGKPGTFEASYFAKAAADNWSWLHAQQARFTAAQGQATGWLPGDYGNPGATAEWEQDYFTGIVVLAARMGDANAAAVANWQRNWVSGRFTAAGFNPHDGCTYNLMVAKPNGPDLATWAQIESATVAAGQSNGAGWGASDGDYCALALSALGGLLTVDPTDTGLQRGLAWLNAAKAPFTDQASFQIDPTFNVVPLK
jgi:hypothetical protein